jgi:Outer membrane protein beta-barrel domain
MTTLTRLCLIAGALVSVAASRVDAQFRGIVGAGLSVPVDDFADENAGGAQAGGGTVILGAEWLPAGRSVGLRLDGDFAQFCTTFCDDVGGNLDIKYQILNANLSGLVELGSFTGRLRPYLLAGLGIYNYRLRGDDVPSTGDFNRTDFGLSGGLGLNFDLGRVGLFAESRYHNVFSEGSNLQYIPVTIGLKVGR